jgi:hypothetical protein
MTPPRTGLRLIIAPWEYRHLRVYGRAHLAGAGVLTILALVILSLGGSNWTAYGWALCFAAVGLAHLAVGLWELGIADSSDHQR